ncbi:hypothetical protein [Aeromonas media]|uniref:hypothetical protein n=1 Tax=Aeromonas media TaxID=651 RepID=UPI00111A499B|nr:hypothetical protein [Aeromonas media]
MGAGEGASAAGALPARLLAAGDEPDQWLAAAGSLKGLALAAAASEPAGEQRVLAMGASAVQFKVFDVNEPLSRITFGIP